jgi:hypothetical protein
MDTEKKYKIRILSNGIPFTYTDCIILTEPDNTFIKFKDKFNIVFLYNKNTIVSMEEEK